MSDTNSEILKAITELSNTVHAKLNVMQSQVGDILFRLTNQPPPPPPDPILKPLFSTSIDIKFIQLKETTRMRIPRLDKKGQLQYTKKGGLKFHKPGSAKKVIAGRTYKVWGKFIQGDGTRLYESADWPGTFFIERQINRL